MRRLLSAMGIALGWGWGVAGHLQGKRLEEALWQTRVEGLEAACRGRCLAESPFPLEKSGRLTYDAPAGVWVCECNLGGCWERVELR